jgi:pimeloyl-ACP methyl ester carboxylesterase
MSSPPLKKIQANGLTFGYFEEGAGPLVLMVHGFPDTAHTWDEVRPAVAASGFRVVTPFTRGYFPTEIPSDGLYDSDTLGKDVLALIAALGEESAIVVGHDWGASAAYSAAGLEPGRVRLLVTIAIPHPATMIPTPSLLWTVRHFLTLRLPGAAKRIRSGDFTHLDELVQRWSPGWSVPKGETDAVKAALAPAGHLEASLAYYATISPILPKSQRRKVEVPAAAFAGATDIVAPSTYERARSHYTKSYEVVKVEGAHFMHRQHPEQFIRELVRVLAPYR